MRDNQANFDEVMARWLFDNGGDPQRCMDMVHRLMDMDLLVYQNFGPEIEELLLREQEVGYANSGNPSRSRGVPFLDKLLGREQKTVPVRPVYHEPPEPGINSAVQEQLATKNAQNTMYVQYPDQNVAQESRYRQQLEVLQNKLSGCEARLAQQEAEQAKLEEQYKLRISALEAEISEQKQAFEEKLQKQEEQLRHREEELMQKVTYTNADAHDLIVSAGGNRDLAYQMTQSILNECKTFRQQQEQMLMELKRRMMETCNGAGIEKLAELYGRMENSKSPEVKAYLWNLKNVMTAFGLRSFTPQKGDAFDPRIHEPKIIGEYGSRVAGCYAAGWMLGDEIITRAVVETEDE